MQLTPLRLPGAYLIQMQPRHDDRGHFVRAWDDAIFARHGLTAAWVQENQSYNREKGTLRGLHYQAPPAAETKLVRVVAGSVLDVFVDLRVGSPTYGQWEAVELSAANHRAVWVPKGCAHGYCTLTPDAVVVYRVDAYYTPATEGGLRWDDPALNIPWPVRDPVLSAKDRTWPDFKTLQSPFQAAPPAGGPDDVR